MGVRLAVPRLSWRERGRGVRIDRIETKRRRDSYVIPNAMPSAASLLRTLISNVSFGATFPIITLSFYYFSSWSHIDLHFNISSSEEHVFL
jgi:hypothetical protein